LGYVLEIAGNAELADSVQEWLPTGLDMVPLSSSQPGSAAGDTVQRWRIRQNAKLLGT
jgi:hypothetical protein